MAAQSVTAVSSSPEVEVHEIRVAEVAAPHGSGARERIGAAPWRTLWALVLGIAALAAALGGLGWPFAPSPTRRSPALTAAARAPGPVGVAGAYGYSARCLSITIPAIDPTYARADFDRREACGRYGGYPTAIFHRSQGAWRVVLDAAAYSCPVASIPPAVQATLGVCDSLGSGSGGHPLHGSARGPRS